jgi:hypothetical protein
MSVCNPGKKTGEAPRPPRCEQVEQGEAHSSSLEGEATEFGGYRPQIIDDRGRIGGTHSAVVPGDEGAAAHFKSLLARWFGWMEPPLGERRFGGVDAEQSFTGARQRRSSDLAGSIRR